MMNITKTLNEFLLENRIIDVDVIYNDLFMNPEGLEIISRHDPSQAKVKEFIDGSSVGQMQVAYYVRSANPKDCRDILQEISSALDGLRIIDIEDEQYIYDCSVDTLPNFISIDDKNQSVYTIEVSISYTHGGLK